MILFLVISLSSAFLVSRTSLFQVEGLSAFTMLWVFVLKCLVGFGLLWLYGSYIDISRADADVFKYFDDAVVMHSSAKESLGLYFDLFSGSRNETLAPYYETMYNWDNAIGRAWFDDHRTMIRVHSMFLFISQGDIRVHQVLFALISLTGLVFLFKGLRSMCPVPASSFLAVCVLPPSLLFWGSGLVKEALVMMPFGLVIYGMGNWGKRRNAWWTLLIGLILFVFVKPYVLFCLIPGSLFLLLDRKMKIQSVWSAVLTISILLGIVAMSSLSPRYDLLQVLAQVQENFVEHARIASAGSMVAIHPIEDMGSFLVQLPRAGFNGLFRPGPWEVRGVLDAMAALENFIYILLILAAFTFRNKSMPMRPFLFSILTVLSMAILLGSVIPVLGAVVRYKAPVLPFLLFALILAIDFKRIPFFRTRA